MKPWLRHWLVWCAAGIAPLVGPSVQAGFTLTDLGPIAPGQSGSATGINAQGMASGSVFGAGRSVAVSTGGGGGFQAIDMSGLPGVTSSSGAAIDGHGDVTGTFFDSIDGKYHAFETSNGKAVDYGTFAGAKFQGANSWGVASSATGEMVGTARLVDGTEVAFRSTSPGTLTAISLPGGSQFGQAGGINGAGTAVGTYLTGAGVYKVFVDKEGAPATDLLSQYSTRGFGLNSYAAAINDRGDVAGYGDFNGQTHAFIAGADGKFTDIGVTGGFSSSISAGINNLGQVVGQLGGGGGSSHALIYDPTAGLFDLNTLLTPSDQAIWTLTSATGINDNDQIVGQGLVNGQLHGFLLTLTPGSTLFAPAVTVPAPPSAWMAIGGLAIVGGWARVRRGRTAGRGTA